MLIGRPWQVQGLKVCLTQRHQVGPAQPEESSQKSHYRPLLRAGALSQAPADQVMAAAGVHHCCINLAAYGALTCLFATSLVKGSSMVMRALDPAQLRMAESAL